MDRTRMIVILKLLDLLVVSMDMIPEARIAYESISNKLQRESLSREDFAVLISELDLNTTKMLKLQAEMQ